MNALSNFKLTLPALVLVFAIGFGFFRWRGVGSTDGILSIDPPTKDLGTVVYGEVAETNFALENNTSQTVQVTRVSTSCGCTKAFLDKERLKPGKKAKIHVTFDPAVHKDDSDLGKITRTIYLKTNHPNFSSLEATITALVVR